MVGDPEINYNEEPRYHTTNEGVQWLRTGYCCQCGECCKGCSQLVWITENVRGVCKDRLDGVKEQCGQDVTWPPTPLQVAHCPSCTYKFEIVS